MKKLINLEQQTTLAKLLAQENIHVIHGNYHTAWFNPTRRVLALPVWKDRGKAVYDLLTGHEVGHALYTPAQGWHDAVLDIKGAPKAYLNVLEDVRIERKIQDRYPGLRSQFQKAYKILSDEDFFGLSKVKDIQKLRIIDRINLKSKMAGSVQLEFVGPIEKDFHARSYETQTFGDVVSLAKEIYTYEKEQRKLKNVVDILEEDTLDNLRIEDEDSDQANPNDYDKQDEEDNTSTEDLELPEVIIKPNFGNDGVIKDELGQDDAIDAPNEDDNLEDDDESYLNSITDESFRNNESSLTAKDELKNIMVYTLNPLKQKSIIIDYKEYYAQWKLDLSQGTIGQSKMIAKSETETEEKFTKFKTETQMASSYMAKEFEMRKAAFQYSRSSVHKTGTINTNRLHSYKYSDDIFLKTSRLANYKNHGMMMFIDFSGSMKDSIGATIRQMLSLAMFCRMVSIPFEVYSFTTIVKFERGDSEQDYNDYYDCEVIPQKFNMLNLMSSRMTRQQAQEATKMLWKLAAAWDNSFSSSYINAWNQLHSTPLNSCIQYATTLVNNFKAKHNIEKMTTMFLTDGESDTYQVRVSAEGDDHRNDHSSSQNFRSRSSVIRINGETLEVGSLNSANVTTLMLKNLKKKTNSTVLGFFISEYRSQAIAKVCGATSTSNKEKYTSQITKQRAIIEDDVFGYDRYFGLCAKFMDVSEDELGELVEDGASKNKLKTAFTKLTKQKRVNRIFLNAFVDSIA